ncbi:MAG TPA: AI-2E family transporter [Firmicutes bacterium]|nr:AI-2E family transporter [Bacillota bacterium]
MVNGPRDTQFVKRAILLAGLVLVIVYFNQVLKAAKSVYDIVLPLVLGFIIAYVVNILMRFLERHYFPKAEKPWIARTRRPVCLLLSYVLILLILAAVITLVLPKVVDTIKALSAVLPGYWERISQWVDDHKDQWSFVSEWMDKDALSWDSITDNIKSNAPQSLRGIFTSSLTVISGLTSGLFDLVVGLAFSAYLLASKERLLAQAEKLQKAFLPPSTAARFNTILAAANESFASFITGQCTEAVILGALCIAGMLIFGFPYATSIGIFVGVTSLIPILGAYLGAAVGVLLIFQADPAKALLFVVFIIVLQQLEGNLIYPRVMGTSLGLPGLWVFAAVVIGGGLGGIVGMLFGVPTAATIYKLVRAAADERTKAQAQRT